MSRSKYTKQEQSYKNSNIVGIRLTELRIKSGMSQKDLAEKLQLMLDMYDAISPITISSYERGTRLPSLIVIITLAQIFGVTVDYIVGADTKIPQKKISNDSIEKNICPLPEIDCKIPSQKYESYNEMPVFVKNSNGLVSDYWAILDYYGKRLISKNRVEDLMPSHTLYSMKPYSSPDNIYNVNKSLNMKRLINEKIVWIEPCTSDDKAKALYSGYYKHNENRSMLINIANSLTLNYNGLGIAYNAYVVDFENK